MSIRGEIQTMPLADLFQWLVLKGKTGALALMHEETAQKLYFHEGLIASAVSTPYPVARNEPGLRQMLTETLGWREGRFDFTEAPLPHEALAINLRLDPWQLVRDIFNGPGETAPAAHAMGTSAGHQQPTAGQLFSPDEGLRLAIFDRLLKGNFKLPLLPTLVSKVMEITQRDNYSLRDLSNVILTDQVIAAQLLKHANSAAYASARTIDSMPMAVQHLGSETVVNIVFALSVQSASIDRGLFLGTKKQLWEHASGCALLARVIALPLRLDHNLAFLCALMMDFGKIVLLSIIQDLMAEERAYQKTSAKVVHEVIEAYHSKAGSEVGQKWQLPPPVLDTITYHHNLAAAGDHRTYAAVANLSDVMITAFTQAPHPKPEDPPALPTAEELAQLQASELLGLSAAQLEPILEHVPDCVKSAQGFLMK